MVCFLVWGPNCQPSAQPESHRTPPRRHVEQNLSKPGNNKSQQILTNSDKSGIGSDLPSACAPKTLKHLLHNGCIYEQQTLACPNLNQTPSRAECNAAEAGNSQKQTATAQQKGAPVYSSHRTFATDHGGVFRVMFKSKSWVGLPCVEAVLSATLPGPALFPQPPSTARAQEAAILVCRFAFPSPPCDCVCVAGICRCL